MKTCLPFSLLLLLVQLATAQTDSFTHVKALVGISAPELLHAGISVDLSKWNQLGFAAGVGPSWNQVWPTLSLEHRLYFGKIKPFTGRRRWFFRQGGTWFTAGDEGALTLTIGADLNSRRRGSGWTIDLGTFILFRNRRDEKNIIYPALRFQYYGYFKRSRNGRSPERWAP